MILLGLTVMVGMATLPQKLKYSGMTFTDERYCPNVSMGSSVSTDSLKHLATTGTNYVAVAVTQYQTNMNSTVIYPLYNKPTRCSATPTGWCKTVTNENLIATIDEIHSLGMKVMLKPHIDLIDDTPQHWRGNIGENFNAQQWDTWFASYEPYIMQYAEIAQKTGVEMFSVSCELIAASKEEQHWRNLIPKIRNAYNGTLTDSANWSPPNGPGELTDKKWWDLMDVIGCDEYYIKQYYNLIDGKYPTMEQLLAAWAPVEVQMAALHQKWNKPIVFTEMGYCSGFGADCFANGGKVTHAPTQESLDSQATQFEAALTAMTKYDWFEGVFWWNWATDAAFGGMNNSCMDPKFKPAENVLRKWYKATEPIPAPPMYPPVCSCWL
eukprot:TRINITY_DN5512_c0_g1_i1.p1 TRINITY_DN5512_c0_g1~~TRINITY_DN5512_c0_g1_i1.p1  ORF type:complete len:397 (+),score=94.87 TRINITY_DN5512_c0_g1_i1:50-1192(+)